MTSPWGSFRFAFSCALMNPIGMIPCFFAALSSRLRARSRASSSSKATWLKRARALRTCDASWIGRRRRPRESICAKALSGSFRRSLALSRGMPACSQAGRARRLGDQVADPTGVVFRALGSPLTSCEPHERGLARFQEREQHSMIGRIRHAGVTGPNAGLAQVGATGFEPATFWPPAERQSVSMCPGASAASYVSRAVDDLDR